MNIEKYTIIKSTFKINKNINCIWILKKYKKLIFTFKIKTCNYNIILYIYV